MPPSYPGYMPPYRVWYGYATHIRDNEAHRGPLGTLGEKQGGMLGVLPCTSGCIRGMLGVLPCTLGCTGRHAGCTTVYLRETGTTRRVLPCTLGDWHNEARSIGPEP